MIDQAYLDLAARIALQEAAKTAAAKVVDFEEKRDEIEHRRRKRKSD